jgi:hypothetical protein
MTTILHLLISAIFFSARSCTRPGVPIGVNGEVDDVYFKRLQGGCHKIKSYTKMQTSQRRKRLNIRTINDTDITEQPNNGRIKRVRIMNFNAQNDQIKVRVRD